MKITLSIKPLSVNAAFQGRRFKGKPCVRVAVASICTRCRKIREVRLAEFYKGKVQLFQIDKLYGATHINIFSEEELRTGKEEK